MAIQSESNPEKNAPSRQIGISAGRSRRIPSQPRAYTTAVRTSVTLIHVGLDHVCRTA